MLYSSLLGIQGIQIKLKNIFLVVYSFENLWFCKPTSSESKGSRSSWKQIFVVYSFENLWFCSSKHSDPPSFVGWDQKARKIAKSFSLEARVFPSETEVELAQKKHYFDGFVCPDRYFDSKISPSCFYEVRSSKLARSARVRLAFLSLFSVDLVTISDVLIWWDDKENICWIWNLKMCCKSIMWDKRIIIFGICK